MKVAVFIDGGHTRVLTRQAGNVYNPDYIERLAHQSVVDGEKLLRILYYDCAPYNGKQTLPVSGEEKVFHGSDAWLNDLARRDLFAVRRGVLKFRGFKPRRIPIASETLTDSDFKPDFEQKGVDMRIGLDIVRYAATRSIERVILMSGDTDCLPAMKRARIEGLQVVLIKFPNHNLSNELQWHSDFVRAITWP